MCIRDSPEGVWNGENEMKVVFFYDKEAERYLQCMGELEANCRLCLDVYKRQGL